MAGTLRRLVLQPGATQSLFCSSPAQQQQVSLRLVSEQTCLLELGSGSQPAREVCALLIRVPYSQRAMHTSADASHQ